MIDSPHLSIVIPARDEEKYLSFCLDSITTASACIKEKIEVIVVINRCTDRTEEIAKQAGCLIVHCEAKNLAAIRNIGVTAASAEIVVTVDADSKVSPNMFVEILKHLSTNKVIGGGVWIYPERLSLGIFLTGLMILPTIIKNRILCGLFFFKKKDFEAIGGFDESLASVEDIDFAIRLKHYGKTQGKQFKTLVRAYILTSCRKFDHFGDWYFVRRPGLVWKLLRGRDQAEADRIWYEFPR